jgi:hypothetical protein
MRAYRAVTGGHDLSGFWKMSPAEVFAWSESMGEEKRDIFEDMTPGDEIED